MDKKFFINLNYEALKFVESLGKDNLNFFYPLKKGLTISGKNLNMGFLCYGLKIMYMSGQWDNLSDEKKKNYKNSLNLFQKIEYKDFNNYFIDQALIDGYESIFSALNTKHLVKTSLSMISKKKYETKKDALHKAINADNKQAISTMNELNFTIPKKIEYIFTNETEILNYLNSLDWSTPWTSGAQFSSICTYSNIFQLNFEKVLYDFSSKILNSETGSYHNSNAHDSREIINGAMKIITGLDWINEEIHDPKKLIDYCIDNQPYLEGCDIVDFVYVLYKCSNQDNHRKNEVTKLLINLLEEIMKLYHPKDGAFSYFKNSSQTHYYGLKISRGFNTPDLHGTLLCIWAINMILDLLEYLPKEIKIIKP